MINILLAAGIVILLLAANIVILIVVLHRTRQRKGPYRGLFTTVDTAIRRETDKVFSALHASVPEGRAPSHWLLAEASDEHTGLFCGIAARPGPARLRIKKAVHERVKKADIRLEDTMRACLEKGRAEWPLRGRATRKSCFSTGRSPYATRNIVARPNPITLATTPIGRRGSSRTANPTTFGRQPTKPPSLRRICLGDDDTMAVIKTVVLDMQELKGFRKDFEEVHRMTFGGNPPPPNSDDRKTPVEMFVAEAELAHDVIVDWVWRLAARKSRRLNVLLWQMERLRRATLRAFPAYADALETAATERGASNAKAIGECLHNLPNHVVKAMAECMTDMERNFAAMGVFTCIEARVEKPHDMATVFDWSFQDPWYADDREPEHPAPTYARTLGSRSFRRKMEVILGQDITMDVISAYDDAISARRLRARVAAACRKHGVALPESAEDMAAVVENHPYFTSLGPPRNPKYRKMHKHEMFRQAVDDAVASVLCQEIEPQSRGGCLDPRITPAARFDRRGAFGDGAEEVLAYILVFAGVEDVLPELATFLPRPA